MKNKIIFYKIIFLAALSVLAVFLTACVSLEKEAKQPANQETGTAVSAGAAGSEIEVQKTAQKASVSAEQEIVVETGAAETNEKTKAQQPGISPGPSESAETYGTTSPSNPFRKAESMQKGISEISYDEPHEYLDITDMKFTRTSRDKAELKELTLTFRNIEYQPIKGIVIMTFEDVYVEDHKVTAEKEFELPEVKPGMKFVKVFPVGVYYHSLGDKKEISLSFYKKYETPRKYVGEKSLSIVPIDLLGSMEMKWV